MILAIPDRREHRVDAAASDEPRVFNRGLADAEVRLQYQPSTGCPL